MSNSMGLTDVLNEIDDDSGGDELKVREVVSALETRGYGPLMLAPAMLTVLPTGGIPGVPTVTAILVLFIAAQIVIGKETPWIPQKLSQRSIKRQKFEDARKKAEPYTKKFDQILKPRLKQLVSSTGTRIVAGICILLACLLPPLEVVPFAAIIPASAIAILSVGISANDGLVIIAGMIAAIFGLMAAGYWLL